MRKNIITHSNKQEGTELISLIIGIKGTGKTKRIVSMANEALNSTDGSVVFVEKSCKLIHEVKHQVRLVDTDEYMINDARSLYGFVTGIFASNHDVTDIFIDSALKICCNDMAEFVEFMTKLDKFVKTHNINIVITSSIAPEALPAELSGFMI